MQINNTLTLLKCTPHTFTTAYKTQFAFVYVSHSEKHSDRARVLTRYTLNCTQAFYTDAGTRARVFALAGLNEIIALASSTHKPKM